MKWLVLAVVLLVVAALGVGLFLNRRPEKAEAPAPAPGTKVVTIPVEGMVCASCTARVKRSLEAMDGVADVEVSLERRQARVRYVEARLSPQTLVTAINELGYKAGTPTMERER
jgi:copper chaperone CopZ